MERMTTAEKNARKAKALQSLEPTVDADGRAWWAFSDICDALKIFNRDSARKYVPNDHARTVLLRGYRYVDTRRVLMIDSVAVEQIAIYLGGRMPRAEIMAALRRRPRSGEV